MTYRIDEERERRRREDFREDEFLFTAAHEAGHAIVCEAVAPGSVESLRVWAADGNRFAGEVVHTGCERGSRSAALIAVAGAVGEQLFALANADWRRQQYEQGNRASGQHRVWVRRSDGDEDKLKAYLGYIREPAYEKHRIWELEQEVRAILRTNWAAFAGLVEAVIAARAGMGGASLSRAQIMAAIEGRAAVAPKAPAAGGKRAAVTGGQEMTLQEKIEVRDQAIKAGNDYLARILTQNIEWHQGKRARTGAGPMETAALGNAARRGNRQGR